jgi:3-oxoacyl-(acyl-carrier-protein) synthase
MSRRRVVVTGLGLVSPVGIGVEESWSALVAGRSGIGPITLFDASTFPTRIAGEVKGFDPAKFMDRKEVRRNDRFIHFALAAAEMAVKDAGLDMSKEDPNLVGCIVGAGMGGLGTIEEEHKVFNEKGVRKIGPFFIPSLIINLAPGQISLRYGMKGPNFSPVSACATGNHSIGDAMIYIERGLADVMVTGGCEATITPMGVGGFCAARALSERNDAPEKASRPFDKHRDGFVAGEGSGILILEEYEHARKRGARIYAELGGYGATADANHITGAGGRGRPARDADGAARRGAPPRGRRLREHARHLDAGRRRRRVPGDQQGLRRAREEGAHGVVDEVDDRPPARRRGRPRGGRDGARDRARHPPADHQRRGAGSGVRPRRHPEPGARAPRRRRHLELVRVRRHERGRPLQARLRGLSRTTL